MKYRFKSRKSIFTLGCILLCVILSLIGCGQKSTEDLTPIESPPVTDSFPEPNPDPKPESESESESIPIHDIDYSKSIYENEIFLAPGYFSIYNGLLYYSSISSDRMALRRCELDLSNEETFFEGSERYNPPFCINPDGRFIIENVDFSPAFPERDLSIYNVNDDSVENGILKTNKYIYGDIVLYKDKIILVEEDREADIPREQSINVYSDEGIFVKTVFTGNKIDFGVINDAIYFLSYQFSETQSNELKPVQSVMRYDLKTEGIEKLFDFDISELSSRSDLREVVFNGRNLIVRVGFTSFVYTNIDNIDPKRISFTDQEIADWDYVNYISSNDDDFYFVLHHSEGGEGGYLFSEIYKVLYGTTQPIIQNEQAEINGQYYADGYMYYIVYPDFSISELKRAKCTFN